MNNLSWFLYGVDVLTNLSSFLTTITFTLMIVIVGMWIVSAFMAGDIRDEKKVDALFARVWKYTKIAATFLVLSIFLNGFIPEKNTLYAIAASQFGEKVSQTDVANDAIKALHAWIKKQIDPVKDGK